MEAALGAYSSKEAYSYFHRTIVPQRKGSFSSKDIIIKGTHQAWTIEIHQCRNNVPSITGSPKSFVRGWGPETNRPPGLEALSLPFSQFAASGYWHPNR